MSNNIVVTLGDVEFSNLEVPSKMPLGGRQTLVEHKLVGGNKIVDAMGFFEVPKSWTGIFFGSNADARAKHLAYLCEQGKPLYLTWHQYSFIVVIEDFTYDFERINKIPYAIACCVIKDNTAKPVDTVNLDPYTTVDDDFERIAAAYESMILDSYWLETVGNDELEENIPNLKTAWQNINGAMNATSQQIMNVKSAIQDVQNSVTRQIASASNFLQTVTTLGGVLPNNPLANNTSRMMLSVRNVNNSAQLMNMQNLLGVSDRNLNQLAISINSKTTQKNQNNLFTLPTTQVVRNTNLYALASMYYKDAMKWVLIAKENKLTSPYIIEPITLFIPIDGDSGDLLYETQYKDTSTRIHSFAIPTIVPQTTLTPAPTIIADPIPQIGILFDEDSGSKLYDELTGAWVNVEQLD